MKILEGTIHADHRGYLYKQYLPSQNLFSNFLVSHNPTLGTVRGLHCQPQRQAEFKLITCIRGAVIDFLLDLREDSTTFGDWCEYKLSEQETKSLFVPPGIAHGFQTIESQTSLLYLVSGEYIKEDSMTINIQDSKIGINLPLSISEISLNDQNALSFQDNLLKLNNQL